MKLGWYSLVSQGVWFKPGQVIAVEGTKEKLGLVPRSAPKPIVGPGVSVKRGFCWLETWLSLTCIDM